MATRKNSASTNQPFNPLETLRRYLKQSEWLYVVVGMCMGAVLPFILRNLGADKINSLLNNLVPEAISIFFTVLILDRLDSIREEKVIKDQLIRRAQSRYNHTALQAIEEMRVLGYLEDGTLKARNLRGANWVDANMYMADLRKADLTNANLDHADMVLANLEGAKVTDEQLCATFIMHKAIMPDGRTYDGRYNLEGDFAYARRKHVNIHDDRAIADWFGVELEQYLEGQRWADHHLVHLRQ